MSGWRGSVQSAAKTRNAFYDSSTDTTVLNSSYTTGQSDNVVAGKIAHEAIGHKVGGESEFVAGFVENTVKNNWSDFQSGNTSLQLTVPQPTIPNNNYANALGFAPGSGVYSDVYIGGKVRIPFPGKDYDIHSGIQSNILFREDSIGTDGRGTNFLVIPEIGVGMYAYKIPHGETPSVSTSWGYRNTISADYIRTKEGGSGFGYTVGISTAPATILPINVSVSIPEKK